MAALRSGSRAAHAQRPIDRLLVHPDEHFLRLAIVTLGRDLARRAYPEIDALDLR
jgi:hypothetical protein